MAVKRAVSTVIAVQGEKEYKAAMQEIQRENRTLVSALKLVEAQYKGNANSMAALEAKGKALKAMLDGQREAVNRARAGLENAKSSQDAYAQKQRN